MSYHWHPHGLVRWIIITATFLERLLNALFLQGFYLGSISRPSFLSVCAVYIGLRFQYLLDQSMRRLCKSHHHWSPLADGDGEWDKDGAVVPITKHDDVGLSRMIVENCVWNPIPRSSTKMILKLEIKCADSSMLPSLTSMIKLRWLTATMSPIKPPKPGSISRWCSRC